MAKPLSALRARMTGKERDASDRLHDGRLKELALQEIRDAAGLSLGAWHNNFRLHKKPCTSVPGAGGTGAASVC